MGSKADFYIKTGDTLEWHGSIEWDVAEKNIPEKLIQSASNEEFLANLQEYFQSRRDDAKPVTAGWPWFWATSKQTDYAYIMVQDRGMVYISKHNSPCYSIYDFRNYKKRELQAKKEGKEIDSFDTFIKKVSPFTPNFPKMRNE